MHVFRACVFICLVFSQVAFANLEGGQYVEGESESKSEDVLYRRLSRDFTFEQATLLIHDCSMYSFQLPNGNGPYCLEIVNRLTDWVRERYVGPEEVVAAIQMATHIRELFVPIFSLAANASRLDRDQSLQAAKAVMLALDKMGGFRGELAYENEKEAEKFIRFAVDAAVSMAVSGVEPKLLIGYLNDMSVHLKDFRYAYDNSVKKRVRFLIDYASAAPVRKLSFAEKTSYSAGLAFRPFEWDLRIHTRPRHLPGMLQMFERLMWRKEAEKLVIDRPLLVVLEGLLQNYGVKVVDFEKTSGEDEFIVERPYYKLHQMGRWAGYILTKLGFDIEQNPRNDKKKKKEVEVPFIFCEEKLVPLPIPVSTGSR